MRTGGSWQAFAFGAKGRRGTRGARKRLRAAVIVDALRLPGGALESVRGDELDRHPDAGDGVDLAVDPVAQLDHLAHLVSEVAGPDLDLHDRLVERAGARDLDEVMGRRPLDAQERLLDLRREDVHPADDEHVVRAPDDAAHADAGAAAGAGPPVERGEVARPVAEHRQRLLRERREDELARLAVADRLERLRVHALDDEVILLDVHAGARAALARDAGADHLGEAVVVEGEDAEATLDLEPHLLGPRLAAEVAEAERQGARGEPLRARDLRDVEGVRRRADEDLGPEVADEQHLARGVTAGGRHDARADLLDAVVEAEATGEEAVAERDVDEVLFPQAPREKEARDEPGPGLEVLPRVGDEGRAAGRAGGAVDAGDLRARHREQAERVVPAQVVLHRERQAPDVFDGAEVLRRDARGPERVAVEGDARRVPHRLGEPPRLERAQLLARERLRRIPDPGLDRELRQGWLLRARPGEELLGAEELHARLGEELRGALRIGEAEHERREVAALAPGGERVHVLDPEPRLLERLEDRCEAARPVGHVHREHLRDVHDDPGCLERGLGLLPVLHDEAQDAELLRVGERHREDVDPGVAEHLARDPELAGPVLEEERQLADLHGGPLQMFRLSSTRFALPSLRAMVRGATRWTFTRMPTTWSIASPSFRCSASSAPIVSENASEVTSTCTSISSSPCSRVRTIW